MKALNVNKLAECGVSFKFWCAFPLPLPTGRLPHHHPAATIALRQRNLMASQLRLPVSHSPVPTAACSRCSL